MPARTTKFRLTDGQVLSSSQQNENQKDDEAAGEHFHGNRVISGFLPTATAGTALSVDVPVGEAYIGGRHIAPASGYAPLAIPASVTRWVWLKGTNDYTDVAGVITDVLSASSFELTAAAGSPTGDGALLCSVTTNGTDVTSVTDMRDFANRWSDRNTYNMANGVAVIESDDFTMSARLIEVPTAKTSNYTILSTESNLLFTNSGASAQVILTLPASPVTGQIAKGLVAAAFNLRVICAFGHVIRFGAFVSQSASYIQSSTVGSFVTLEYNGSNVWVVQAHTGRWAVNAAQALYNVSETGLVLRKEIWRADAYAAQTISREDVAATSLAALSTGVLYLVGTALFEGQVVTNITFSSAGTGAGTPTNWWFALYSYARALLRQTADQTTTAWASTTEKTVALTSPYTITETGRYYLGVMVAAATVPTLNGTDGRAALNNDVPIRAGRTTDTGLTTTAPANAAAIANTENIVAWAAIS